MSVDLPAPFSPTRAWISPGRRSNETSSSARTPGKVFVMPRISSRGAESAALVTCSEERGRVISARAAVDLFPGVVAVLDDGLVDVVFVDGDRLEEDRGYVDFPVVDGVGRRDRLLAGELDRGIDRGEG